MGLLEGCFLSRISTYLLGLVSVWGIGVGRFDFPEDAVGFLIFLGVTSPFFPGILLSRKPSWFLKRTMVKQNGESTPRILRTKPSKLHRRQSM